MHNRKWIGWVICTSLVGSGLSAVPASAQLPTQADVTGTNIWHNTVPIFESDGELDPEIAINARRLSQELEEASALCCNALAPVGPRRFARGPADSNAICSNPDCAELDRLVQEARTFVDNVNGSYGEQVRVNRNRTW